jgi:hypothetical protein
MAVASPEAVQSASVILDIGGDVGALIVYTKEELLGREVEVSRKSNAARRTHTDVLERRVQGRLVYAAVFAELPAGDYTLWKNNQPDDEVTIAGGGIAEVDWRNLALTPALRLARPHPALATLSQPAATANVPDALLPRRYRNGGAVRSTPMGSAPMRYSPDGQVAWDEMWTDFCDLALAGGPPHRDTVLDPPAPDPVLTEEEAYRRVVAEIERGIRMVTGLRTVVSDTLGWVGLQCEDEDMAHWLLRAIAVENVSVRRDGSILFLPAGPDFRLDKEIKNVVTVVAKTHHYYSEHLLD